MPLSCKQVGVGRPVVLLHAFPLSSDLFKPQLAALAPFARILTPDLPGFGNTPLLAQNPTVDTVADALAQTLDNREVREPIILGGVSMGGYVTFAFARKYPHRVAGLILANTRAEADDEVARNNREKMLAAIPTQSASEIVRSMIPRLLGAATQAERPDIVAEVARMGSVQRLEGIAAAVRMLRDRPDSTANLAEIRVPTLIVVGTEDILTPPPLAEKMASEIQGAKLVKIEKAGHLANLEQAERFNEAVIAFLQGL
jgi:pimeloyl-ACP methyl ester carboxylesterase